MKEIVKAIIIVILIVIDFLAMQGIFGKIIEVAAIIATFVVGSIYWIRIFKIYKKESEEYWKKRL